MVSSVPCSPRNESGRGRAHKVPNEDTDDGNIPREEQVAQHYILALLVLNNKLLGRCELLRCGWSSRIECLRHRWYLCGGEVVREQELGVSSVCRGAAIEEQ